MIKFLNNIENIISDLLTYKKSIIFFYLDNCENSYKLYDIINNNDYYIKNNIILININNFIKHNEKKYIDNSLNNYIFKLYPYIKNNDLYIFNKNFVTNMFYPKLIFLNNSFEIIDSFTYSYYNFNNTYLMHQLFINFSTNTKNTEKIINSYLDEKPKKITKKNIDNIQKMVIFI